MTSVHLVILVFQDAFSRVTIIVAVASSAFTAFVVPNRVASTPRKVIGGHVVSVVTGTVFAAILLILGVSFLAADARYVLDLFAALAVGLGILIMTLTDTGYLPAADTALGLVIHDWSMGAVGFIMLSALLLYAIRTCTEALINRPTLIG